MPGLEKAYVYLVVGFLSRSAEAASVLWPSTTLYHTGMAKTSKEKKKKTTPAPNPDKA